MFTLFTPYEAATAMALLHDPLHFLQLVILILSSSAHAVVSS